MRALLATVPLLLSGCCFSIPISLPYERCSFTDCARVDSRTAVREERLQVTPAMGPLYVELDVCVESGEGVWQLIGPDGTTRWRCRAGAGRVHHNARFDREPGTWTVRREWRDFTGTQRFSVGAASFAVHLVEWQLFKTGLHWAMLGL